MARKKFDLSAKERVVLLNLLPPQGNLVTMKVVFEMGLNIGFSAQELEDWKIVYGDDGSVKWDGEKSKSKEFEFGVSELGVFKESVKKLDGESRIPLDFLPVIEKLNL